ncbi:saccharopine dehydrogenase family protein [Longimicrobium sp.]|uniref:saccharopine dehydrogenase family protein n=1 Tax=Longimicrobium sp. TaxID=2029185 RepID=UPI002CA4EFF5|nr:saccharopine dehydrogenase C-terminal domain-containing protein [Longimicrobium sp.]HSU15996.1 saccharopine dehydrogenase C-terminal domain-containing protein [Longimicrobium sp.]
MRMLVLGAGQQGSACAYDLLRHTGHDVVIADLKVDALPGFLQPYLGGRLTAVQVDATDRGAVREVMEGAAAVMNAFPYHFNLGMLVAAIDCGAHYADLGGNTEIVLQQKGQHDRAREKGVSAVPDSGLAPGMVNILAQHGIGQMDTVRSVSIKVGGLPQHPEPPLNYQIVYSMEGVVDYYTTLSWVLRDGQPTQVKALSEIEEIDFPGAGTLEAFHTAGGLSTMAQRYAGDVPTMEYKTLRYPGHARIMEAIRDLGLLDLDAVDVKGQRVVPRDVFIKVAGGKLTKDPRQSPDLVALRVEVEGDKDGQPLLLRWDLLDRFDPETGITAMMRTTGYSLAITGALQAAGDVEPGVWTPDEGVPAEPYIEALRQRGVDIRASRFPGGLAAGANS